VSQVLKRLVFNLGSALNLLLVGCDLWHLSYSFFHPFIFSFELFIRYGNKRDQDHRYHQNKGE